MSYMFYECTSLTSIDLSNFNTSNVTNMWGMFNYCSSLTSLDLSSFNTSNVTDMGSMFNSCKQLTILDLSGFNILNVTNMRCMFMSCSSLISLELGNFNTSKVTNMSDMFYGCAKLQAEINIMNASITNYSQMINGALSNSSAYVILGYTTDTQSIAEAMRNTCNNNSSKITLKQI